MFSRKSRKLLRGAGIPACHPCGWRAWLNGTTVTLGVNNVFDLAPPFVNGGENGYDVQTANIKGRTWYAALRKRF